MNIERLSEFIEIAKNSKLVIADYESRSSRLSAMQIMLKEGEKTPLLKVWIRAAEVRLMIIRPLYEASLTAQALPIETLVDIHTQLKAINNE